MMRNQKGFTLIELIIVIVVLGILAVTAAPQFIDFSSDARESTIKGVRGSITGAAQVIYAKSAVEGNSDVADTATPAPSVDGITINYGYPTASATGIIAAAGLDAAADTSAEFSYLIDGGTFIWIVPSDVIATGADTNATASYEDTACWIKYTEPSAAGNKYTVDTDTSGC